MRMPFSFTIKKYLALFLELTGINSIMFNNLNRSFSNNYIRIINYHSVPTDSSAQFEKQIRWLKQHFEFCTKEKLVQFLSGDAAFHEKPGVLLTFDDGFLDNYSVAYPIMKQFGVKAMFMISTELVGKKNAGTQNMDYMTADQILQLSRDGNEICSHTATHHRMSALDDSETLQFEIIQSKQWLEKLLQHPVDIFCWVGGEEETYTAEASHMIREHYQYGMMTNSCPVTPGTDPFQLDRSNIESSWPVSLLKFQIAGSIDRKLAPKRDRIHHLTGRENS